MQITIVKFWAKNNLSKFSNFLVQTIQNYLINSKCIQLASFIFLSFPVCTKLFKILYSNFAICIKCSRWKLYFASSKIERKLAKSHIRIYILKTHILGRADENRGGEENFHFHLGKICFHFHPASRQKVHHAHTRVWVWSFLKTENFVVRKHCTHSLRLDSQNFSLDSLDNDDAR